LAPRTAREVYAVTAPMVAPGGATSSPRASAARVQGRHQCSSSQASPQAAWIRSGCGARPPQRSQRRPTGARAAPGQEAACGVEPTAVVSRCSATPGPGTPAFAEAPYPGHHRSRCSRGPSRSRGSCPAIDVLAALHGPHAGSGGSEEQCGTTRQKLRPRRVVTPARGHEPGRGNARTRARA
jgi:hypothetical protein